MVSQVGGQVAESFPTGRGALTPGPSPATAGEGRTTARKRGGGPKTEAGKAIVRRNPIRHGVLAQTPVIPLVEKPEDWQLLRNGVFAYLKAEGALEEALADRIAGLLWTADWMSSSEKGISSGYERLYPSRQIGPEWSMATLEGEGRISALLLGQTLHDEGEVLFLDLVCDG